MGAVFTLALYVAGHFSADLKHFDVIVGDSPLRFITTGLYYLLPNMAMFDVKNAVVHAQPVPPAYVWRGDGVRRVLHRWRWSRPPCWIFGRRDFK